MKTKILAILIAIGMAVGYAQTHSATLPMYSSPGPEPEQKFEPVIQQGNKLVLNHKGGW